MVTGCLGGDETKNPPAGPSVTFEPAGGTFSVGSPPAPTVIGINADGTVTFPEPPMKRGCAFTGWFTRETGGEHVTPDTVFDSHTTVYAQWGDERAHTPGEWNLGLPSLRRLFSGYFMVGNVMDTDVGAHDTAIPNSIDIPEIVAMYRHHYNAVTPENSFKPGNVWPNKDEAPDFSGHDRLIDWANGNGMHFFGHVLVWHSQSADWLAPPGATREQARDNLETYITAVAGHFAGRIPEWEVVNEVFTDNVSLDGLRPRGWWRGKLRGTPFLQAYANGADTFAGEDAGDYIYDAFVFARLADPGAVLYYNDFNEEFPGKREAIAQMIEELNEQWEGDPRNTPPLRGAPTRLLIEGMGMQSHFHAGQVERYGTERVRDSIRRFAQTGVKISITEFDITARASPNDRNIPITPEEEADQADLYRALFEIYLDEHESINRVTFWGRDDLTHWRNGRHPGLFTGDTRAKEAFFAIAEAAWERAMNNEQ